MPRSEQFLRVLKPTGTFILNIKEKAENGERHTFVIELILALRKQGWLWTEEFIWHKKNSYPGKWPNRFRDSWERCLQFNKTRHFKMNQEAVMVPMGDWAETRLKSLGNNDVVRFDSQVGSGFGKNIANWVGRDKAYPSNVLHLATECGNKSHSAAFPEALPEWFIKLFTDEGDLVLDPFLGSGTTCAVAQKLRRNSIGIEIHAEYCGLAEGKLKSAIISYLRKRQKMANVTVQEITKFIEEHIPEFHRKRLENLSSLKLRKVLRRKNPYLFKAKFVTSAPELGEGYSRCTFVVTRRNNFRRIS